MIFSWRRRRFTCRPNRVLKSSMWDLLRLENWSSKRSSRLTAALRSNRLNDLNFLNGHDLSRQEAAKQNSKSEYRNPKQTQRLQSRNQKRVRLELPILAH